MNILDEIIARKRTEVAERKARATTAQLEATEGFARPVLSLRQALS